MNKYSNGISLQTVGVPATFFINSDNLENNPRKPGQAERNAHSLLSIIQSGNILADHSYDHMSHNSIVSETNFLHLQSRFYT